jgi:hypothetical protein
MDDFFDFLFLILLGGLIGGLLGLIISLPSDEYIERIEEKYPITVVENYDEHVVYNDGKCVAVKLPYDELERVGCGEFSEKLVED